MRVKTWGFQRQSKASWRKGRPKPRQVGKRSAQPLHEKQQRQRRGGEKTWGFQGEHKASRPKGRPKPRGVGKRSAQPTKPKVQRQRHGGEKTWDFQTERKASRPKGRAQNRGESARGAPNQQNRKNSDRGAVGKKLGVSRGNARQLARGAPRTKASWQEEGLTNKTKGGRR